MSGVQWGVYCFSINYSSSPRHKAAQHVFKQCAWLVVKSLHLSTTNQFEHIARQKARRSVPATMLWREKKRTCNTKRRSKNAKCGPNKKLFDGSEYETKQPAAPAEGKNPCIYCHAHKTHSLTCALQVTFRPAQVSRWIEASGHQSTT